MSKLEDALDRLDQSVRALTEAAHADDKTPLPMQATPTATVPPTTGSVVATYPSR